MMNEIWIPTNVPQGARHLDIIRDNWFNEIDLAMLTMHSMKQCILGQLYGDYSRAIKQLFVGATHAQKLILMFDVFGCTHNHKLWVHEIDERKEWK